MDGPWSDRKRPFFLSTGIGHVVEGEAIYSILLIRLDALPAFNTLCPGPAPKPCTRTMSTWYSRPDAYPQYSHQYSQQYPQQQSGQQFTTTFSDQSLYPLMSPENSHLARAPMVKKSSDQIVTYAPSPAMEMPQGVSQVLSHPKFFAICDLLA